MKHLYSIVLFLLLCGTIHSKEAVRSETGLPFLGAQVFIEPGQTAEEVDSWFASMSSNGMKICRIRLIESFVRGSDGVRDFSLFDRAFDAAARNGIGIYLTLFPDSAEGSALGGFKFPRDEDHLERISRFIEESVLHFREHPALVGWVLMNEPGTGGYLPSGSLASRLFSEWKVARQTTGYDSKGYRISPFEREEFLAYCNSWYLGWLSSSVRKYDTGHFLHVNNHNIFWNASEYNFPAWRSSLTSFGASCHPSWHFEYFDRKDYTTAMAAVFSLVRAGAGELPFFVTEMQGGNTTYSGYAPLCPSPRELTQWMWTAFGNGARGVIFWTFNPRSAGEEAGEWAMIDYKGGNTDRLDAVHTAAKVLEENASLLEHAVPLEANVSVLYNRESLWTERRLKSSSRNAELLEGRIPGAVMKSAIGFYEALMTLGINPFFGEWREYDWSKDDYSGEMVILSNLVSLPSYQWDDLRRFVERGGRLVAEGLTAFYDENTLALHHTGFPLEDVFGASLLEVKCIPGDFEAAGMPAHLWHGILDKGDVCRSRYGAGEVLWMPSLFALGARRSGNYKPLASMIENMLPPQKIRLRAACPDVVCSYLESGDVLVSVVCNKSEKNKKLRFSAGGKRPVLLWSDGKGKARRSGTVKTSPGETMLIYWE